MKTRVREAGGQLEFLKRDTFLLEVTFPVDRLVSVHNQQK